jgi:hypothetical protein
LDRDQPAEATAKHKDRPDPQRATSGEKTDAEPANGIAIEGPKIHAVRVSRQIGGQQPDQRKSHKDPSVGTVLTHPWTQIPAGEKRYARQGAEHDHEHGQRRVGEEGRKPAPAEDGQAGICSSTKSCERQSDGRHHHCWLADLFLIRKL